MPRPRVYADGTVVDPKDLERKWVIYCSKTPTGIFGNGYLTRDGRWNNDISQAVAWKFEDKALAEDAVAQIILSNPKSYFETVRVTDILG